MNTITNLSVLLLLALSFPYPIDSDKQTYPPLWNREGDADTDGSTAIGTEQQPWIAEGETLSIWFLLNIFVLFDENYKL